MNQKLPVSSEWSGLLVLAALLMGAVLLVVALPVTVPPTSLPGAGASATAAIRATALANRPDLAPPATRPGVMVATPEFASTVPHPLTASFDPQQVALGRQTYTQWCATCHGDRGQGLNAWRSSWDPAHQNCTQSGCHGARHGEGGFTMLKVAPPLIGPDTLKTYQTAAQLYVFIRATMPFQAPGTLGDDQYWAVTAFLADQRRADAQGKALNETTAASIVLNP
ncbi:MAG: c-type cytochrome [Anaerolineae bacterium]|nr:c-type cytochrome [Anaerolineae bacterium]